MKKLAFVEELIILNRQTAKVTMKAVFSFIFHFFVGFFWRGVGVVVPKGLLRHRSISPS